MANTKAFGPKGAKRLYGFQNACGSLGDLDHQASHIPEPNKRKKTPYWLALQGLAPDPDYFGLADRKNEKGRLESRPPYLPKL